MLAGMSDLPASVAFPRTSICWRSVGIALSGATMLALLVPLFWSFADRSFHVLLENYNEGWNALYIDRAKAGVALYPGADELLLNNYPPLSFYLLAGVSRLVGDAMVAGRLMSAASFLVVTALVTVVVAARGSRAAGLFAGSFFGLSFACFPGQRIGLNDPQLLGHALMLAGLVAVWLAPERAGAVALAAVAMVLGGMVKHNLLAMPVATTVWMMWRGRHSAVLWAWSAGLSGAAGLALMIGIGGPPMIDSMLAPRHVSFAHGLALCRKLIALIDIPLLLSVAGLPSIRVRSDLVFAALLLIAGLTEMVLFAGGDGVVANIAYDLLVGQAIAIGLAVSYVRQPVLIVVPVLFYFSLVLPVDQIKEMLAGNPARATRERVVEADVAYLAAHPGHALCFDPALCWYAGRPPEFDPFNMGQQFSLGLRSSATLTRRLAEKRYAVVELSGEAVTRATYALPADARAALLANYRFDRSSEDRVFLLPDP